MIIISYFLFRSEGGTDEAARGPARAGPPPGEGTRPRPGLSGPTPERCPLSTTPDTRYYTTTRVQSWYATRQGAWSRSTTLYSRLVLCSQWAHRVSSPPPYYPAMVWLSRSRERRVIPVPARSVERQSRGRPHGGAPQWRGDRAHSRGARRPHRHWLWSFPRVLRRDRLPESQELARVF